MRLALLTLAGTWAITCVVACDDDAPAPTTTAATAASASPAPAAATPAPSSREDKKRESQAVTHLPAGCHAALRVDLPAVLRVPELKRAYAAQGQIADQVAGADARGWAAVRKGLEHAGIDIEKDVTELAFCILDAAPDDPGGPPEMVAVAGGKFTPGTVVAALKKYEHFKGKAVEAGGTTVLTREGSERSKAMALAQAADGAVIIGPRVEEVLKALETSDAHKSYSLAGDATISLTLTPAGVSALDLEKKTQHDPTLRQLPIRQFKELKVKVELDPLELDANLDLGSEQAAKEAKGALDKIFQLLAREAAPAQAQALQAAKLSVDKNSLVLELKLSKETTRQLFAGMLQGMVGGQSSVPGTPRGVVPSDPGRAPKPKQP